MLRSVASALRSTSASATAFRSVLEQQSFHNVAVQSARSSRAWGMLTGHTAWARTCTSGTAAGAHSNDTQREQGFTGHRNLDPNVVSVSLLVDTLQLMKKLEVQASPLSVDSVWSLGSVPGIVVVVYFRA